MLVLKLASNIFNIIFVANESRIVERVQNQWWERLIICNQYLIDVPEQVYFSTLNELNLSHNRIRGLSPKIAIWTVMEKLQLNYNNLQALPYEVSTIAVL
jgi:Leucine-rich repeat (LRR) protein